MTQSEKEFKEFEDQQIKEAQLKIQLFKEQTELHITNAKKRAQERTTRMQQLESEHLQLLTENNTAINNAKAKVQPTTTQQSQQQRHQPHITHVPCIPGALVHSNSFSAAQIANEMQAAFGHALTPDNAALFSTFSMKN